MFSSGQNSTHLEEEKIKAKICNEPHKPNLINAIINFQNQVKPKETRRKDKNDSWLHLPVQQLEICLVSA